MTKEEIIGRLEFYKVGRLKKSQICMTVEELQKYIDEIKALEQEPKTGHWHIAHGMYEDRFWCDCGFVKIIDNSMKDWKYCPKCSARMVGDDNE